jgi:hypothetical protein
MFGHCFCNLFGYPLENVMGIWDEAARLEISFEALEVWIF